MALSFLQRFACFLSRQRNKRSAGRCRTDNPSTVKVFLKLSAITQSGNVPGESCTVLSWHHMSTSFSEQVSVGGANVPEHGRNVITRRYAKWLSCSWL